MSVSTLNIESRFVNPLWRIDRRRFDIDFGLFSHNLFSKGIINYYRDKDFQFLPVVLENILISVIAGVLLYIIVKEFLPEKKRRPPRILYPWDGVFFNDIFRHELRLRERRNAEIEVLK